MTNDDLARAIHEQAACASYLRDEAKRRAWCERYGCTMEQARAGAWAGVEDWLIEEVLIRSTCQKPVKIGTNPAKSDIWPQTGIVHGPLVGEQLTNDRERK